MLGSRAKEAYSVLYDRFIARENVISAEQIKNRNWVANSPARKGYFLGPS